MDACLVLSRLNWNTNGKISYFQCPDQRSEVGCDCQQAQEAAEIEEPLIRAVEVRLRRVQVVVIEVRAVEVTFSRVHLREKELSRH